MEIKRVVFGSREYEQTLELRDRILRQPHGISIYDDDLEGEKHDHVVIGAFAHGEILGTMVFREYQPKVMKIRYLCVAQEVQHSGIGKEMMMFAEKYAIEHGYQTMILDSRIAVQGFYEKLGYHTISDIFIPEFVDVAHVTMIKTL